MNKIMGELDTMFNGKASQTYIKHMVQNWSKEPYIQGLYSNEFQDSESKTVRQILQPIDNRIFFAGEALAGDDRATVLGAGESAYAVVQTMLES